MDARYRVDPLRVAQDMRDLGVLEYLYEEALRAFRVNFLEVRYEALRRDPEEGFRRIADFLGMVRGERNFSSTQEIVHARPLEERVENWKDVERALQGDAGLRKYLSARRYWSSTSGLEP
jgi:hypothetical protein